MEFFRRLKGESGYSDLYAFDPEKDREALDLSKPTLFFFPGILSIDNAKFVHHSYSPSGQKTNVQTSEDSVAYKTEVIERIIGRPEMYDADATRFFAMTYTPPRSFMDSTVDRLMSIGRTVMGQTFTGKFFDLWNHSARSHFISRDAEKFTNDIIWPALLDESGQLLPLDILQTKFRNLTLFGDSFGSSFAHQVANSLAARLEAKIGAENTRKLLEEIVFIGASNIVRTENVANPFTAVCFEGNGDKLIHAARGLTQRYRSGLAPSQLQALFSLAASTESEWLNEISENGQEGSEKSKTEFKMDDLPEAIKSISSSFSFTEINGNGSDDLNPLLHYKPDEDSTITGFQATNPSYIKININPPQNYAVCLHRGGNRTYRSYSNTERHQSYCYTYPFTGKRDHSDLLARSLRNALLRSEKDKKISPTELLGDATFARAGGDSERQAQDAINVHLDSLVTPELPHLEKTLRRNREERDSRAADEIIRAEAQYRTPVSQADGIFR